MPATFEALEQGTKLIIEDIRQFTRVLMMSQSNTSLDQPGVSHRQWRLLQVLNSDRSCFSQAVSVRIRVLKNQPVQKQNPSCHSYYGGVQD